MRERAKEDRDKTAFGVIKYLFESKNWTIAQLSLSTGLTEKKIEKIVYGRNQEKCSTCCQETKSNELKEYKGKCENCYIGNMPVGPGSLRFVKSQNENNRKRIRES